MLDIFIINNISNNNHILPILKNDDLKSENDKIQANQLKTKEKELENTTNELTKLQQELDNNKVREDKNNNVELKKINKPLNINDYKLIGEIGIGIIISVIFYNILKKNKKLELENKTKELNQLKLELELENTTNELTKLQQESEDKIKELEKEKEKLNKEKELENKTKELQKIIIPINEKEEEKSIKDINIYEDLDRTYKKVRMIFEKGITIYQKWIVEETKHESYIRGLGNYIDNLKNLKTHEEKHLYMRKEMLYCVERIEPFSGKLFRVVLFLDEQNEIEKLFLDFIKSINNIPNDKYYDREYSDCLICTPDIITDKKQAVVRRFLKSIIAKLNNKNNDYFKNIIKILLISTKPTEILELQLLFLEILKVFTEHHYDKDLLKYFFRYKIQNFIEGFQKEQEEEEKIYEKIQKILEIIKEKDQEFYKNISDSVNLLILTNTSLI